MRKKAGNVRKKAKNMRKNSQECARIFRPGSLPAYVSYRCLSGAFLLEFLLVATLALLPGMTRGILKTVSFALAGYVVAWPGQANNSVNLKVNKAHHQVRPDPQCFALHSCAQNCPLLSMCFPSPPQRSNAIPLLDGLLHDLHLAGFGVKRSGAWIVSHVDFVRVLESWFGVLRWSATTVYPKTNGHLPCIPECVHTLLMRGWLEVKIEDTELDMELCFSPETNALIKGLGDSPESMMLKVEYMRAANELKRGQAFNIDSLGLCLVTGFGPSMHHTANMTSCSCNGFCALKVTPVEVLVGLFCQRRSCTLC